MNDYSEVTCHLQKDVVNLINALNDKKWDVAEHIATVMQLDIKSIAYFAAQQSNKDKK